MAQVNIVLVHGVWMDGSSWRLVMPALMEQGHTVTAVQLPLTSFTDDVATVERVLARQQGKVVLVGHSYGGGVISQAASGNASVAALVYISALAPQPGEPLGSLLGKNPPASQVQIQPDKDGLVWTNADALHDAIAHDVDLPIVELLAAAQKPFAAKVMEGTVAAPAWQMVPSWYLMTTEDRILNPKTQREMATAIKAAVQQVPSSHLPLFSQPDAVSKIILEAAAQA